MLLLFTYPIRKYFFAIRGIGKMSTWFNAHVVLGTAMTFLLIYHTNFFHTHSLNGTFAFYSIVAVVASGFVGRYILRRVHNHKFWADLFKHWHVAHVPVIYMSLVLVLIHVYAIHVY
jgi:hypothetical protein